MSLNVKSAFSKHTEVKPSTEKRLLRLTSKKRKDFVLSKFRNIVGKHFLTCSIEHLLTLDFEKV